MRTALVYLMLCALVGCQNDEENVKDPRPEIPKMSNEPDVLRDDDQAIQIRLGSEEEILVEGNQLHISEIKAALKNARIAKSDTATVVIHLQANSPYGVFAEVHATLEEMLKEVRDSVSQARFQSPYDDLNGTQRTIIDRKYHHRIIEKMRR